MISKFFSAVFSQELMHMVIELIIEVTWWYQQVHGNTCSASDEIINPELLLHLDKKHPMFSDFIRSASIITNRRRAWLREQRGTVTREV